MKTFYIETYGCRMNICDSEIIIRIMTDNGLEHSDDISSADVIILNSCSVREDGHNKIYERLGDIGEKSAFTSKTIIITGCFASLLTDRLFDAYPFVDLIVPPKCYKALPELLVKVENAQSHIVASDYDDDDMYDGILPLRKLEDRTTAAIVIMKGCNQNCSYCIEPITRGKEHCKSPEAILHEAKDISERGYKELTLVGHIIDKYKWTVSETGETVNFAMLLGKVAEACPDLRIKFLSSHPLYFNDETVKTMVEHHNIMRVVHLPIQSASNEILDRMNRGYTKEMFAERVQRIRTIMPDISVITDVMVGFCGETDEDFNQTTEFIKKMKFDDINVFRFSMRNGTEAAKIYMDDISEEEKTRRAMFINKLNNSIKMEKYQTLEGDCLDIVVEGYYSDTQMYGRDMHHRTVVFASNPGVNVNDTVSVCIESVASNVLFGVCR